MRASVNTPSQSIKNSLMRAARDWTSEFSATDLHEEHGSDFPTKEHFPRTNHFTSNNSILDNFKPAGVRAIINTAVPDPVALSFFKLICTSAAIKFAFTCSVRTTFVSHVSVPMLALMNFTNSPGTMRDSSCCLLLLVTACESCVTNACTAGSSGGALFAAASARMRASRAASDDG